MKFYNLGDKTFETEFSLTYPFNIVQLTLSHIVEHCKLDSLAIPYNII